MFELEKLEIGSSSFGSVLLGSRKKAWAAITDPASPSSIDRVWWSAGHLSTSFNNGKGLITFDANPEDKQESEQISDLCLDVRDSNKKLLNLWHYQSQYIVLLYEDGELTCFHFDPYSSTWNVSGSIIVTTTRGATVQGACLHDGVIYWQETTQNENEFNFCYRTLPEGGDDWTVLGFGRQTTVLRRCPYFHFYSTSKGLLIWPRWTKGPAIYLLWINTENLLQVISPNVGVVHSEVLNSPATYFTKLVLKTMASWNQVAPIDGWRAVKQLPRDHQCFLTFDGSLKHVSNTVHHMVKLQDFDSDFIDCMKYRGFLIAAYSSLAKVWNLVTGKLIQVMYFSEILLGCWIGGSTVPVGGFFWSNGIFRLKKLKDMINLTKTREKSQQMHSEIGETISVTNSEKEVPGNIEEKKLETRNTELAEMSTLLNSFLLEHHSPETVKEMAKRLLEIHKHLEMPIQQDLDPLIIKFQNLLLNHNYSPDFKAQSDENLVNILISTLFNTECSLPTSFIRCCLEMVAMDHPWELNRGINENLGEDNVNDLTIEQKKSWDFLLNLSMPQLEVFKTVCRLKYLNMPNKLREFVETALRIKEKHFEVFIYDNPSSIFRQIAKCLPPPSKSVTYTDAAIVLIQLLMKSGERSKLHETLSLIGIEKNWKTVILLSTEISQDPSMKHHYLHFYNTLLAALDEADALPNYQEELLKLVPKNLGMSSILDMVEKFCKKSSTNKLFAHGKTLTVRNVLDLIEQNSS